MSDINTDTVSDNTYYIDLTCHINCHINSNLLLYINSDLLLHINFDMINVYNLNSTFHKISSYIDFDFCKYYLNFTNMTLACFM